MQRSAFRTPMLVVGSLLGLALAIAGLWAWDEAVMVVGPRSFATSGALMRQMRIGAMRCGSVAAIALAQVIWLGWVDGFAYRRDRVSTVLILSGLVVFVISATAAVSLGLVGR